VRWSLPAFKRVVPLAAVRGALDAEALAALEARYALSRWDGCLSAQEWRESLYALDVLRQHLPAALPDGRALDVGSKNGCMLAGLATGAPRGWDACELDAHRRYLWGSTRRVYGERVAAAFPGCRFHACDVRDLAGRWALVTWFLPFLTEGAVAAWGLPKDVLQPEALLRHVLSRVLPGGVVLLVNQGEHEQALQRALLERVGATFRELGRVESRLSPYRRERFGFLVSVSTGG
jgi:hypothetical protein